MDEKPLTFALSPSFRNTTARYYHTPQGPQRGTRVALLRLKSDTKKRFGEYEFDKHYRENQYGFGNWHTIWKKRTMTKFEMAAHFLQQSMLLAQHPIVWVAGVVYFAGCALIGVEFWIIRRELNERDKALDILMKQAVDRGKALDALIERTSK